MGINSIFVSITMARGIVQADFDKLNKSNVGLGLKNISSRLKVAKGKHLF